MAEKREITDIKKITSYINQMEEELPKYKESIGKLTIKTMKQEIADEALESKWKELNLGID